MLPDPSRQRMSQADLVARTARGDAAALAELYAEHSADLFRILYRLVQSRADAEDLLHDLFLGLPELLRRYEERGQLRPWLRTVATRLALMWLRGNRRQQVDVTGEPGLYTTADFPVERVALETAIRRLPDSLRVVFVLRQLEGYSHEEIASLLAISPGSSRVRHTRALSALRRLLEEH
jgi:RNA polymerase sigma-70 factor, ECF subfamily